MRYELLLQTAEPGTPFAAERVRARLEARGLAFSEAGGAEWKLKSGVVEVQPLKEGGVVVATELRVPLSDKMDLIRELLAEGSTVAEEAQVRLFDPQLTRPVSVKDEGAVSDQYFRTARYAGEMLGVSEAIGASFEAPQTGLKPGTKVLMGIIALLALVLWLADRLLPGVGRP